MGKKAMFGSVNSSYMCLLAGNSHDFGTILGNTGLVAVLGVGACLKRFR
jgi:hypothetical protein